MELIETFNERTAYEKQAQHVAGLASQVLDIVKTVIRQWEAALPVIGQEAYGFSQLSRQGAAALKDAALPADGALDGKARESVELASGALERYGLMVAALWGNLPSRVMPAEDPLLTERDFIKEQFGEWSAGILAILDKRAAMQDKIRALAAREARDGVADLTAVMQARTLAALCDDIEGDTGYLKAGAAQFIDHLEHARLTLRPYIERDLDAIFAAREEMDEALARQEAEAGPGAARNIPVRAGPAADGP